MRGLLLASVLFLAGCPPDKDTDEPISDTDTDVDAALHKIAEDGADVVFESTGIPALIDQAIRLCKQYGTFVWQGNYGADPVSLQFLVPHGKRLTMYFPCDDAQRPCRRAVIKNMAMGALEWQRCITHRVDYTESPAMYKRIDEGDTSILGMTVKWD